MTVTLQHAPMHTMTAPASKAPRMTPTAAAPDSADNSTSVLKALQLLDVFRNTSQSVGVSELARRAGIHKSTAFRLLATLERGGFLERVGTKYRLSWRIFELGNRVEQCAPSGLRDVALPFLAELYAASGRAVHLAVLDGAEVVYLEKIHGHKSNRIPSTIGGRMPATCSALGKAILAFSDKQTVDTVLAQPMPRFTQYSVVDPGRLIRQLHQIQIEGVAQDAEEIILGLTCVAAPILSNGRAVAAVSVSSPTTGFNAAATIEMTLRAARGITAALH